MSLKEQLLEDMKDAMKKKDTVRKNAIQMARAAILQTEKDNRITLDDDGVTDVIAKEVKKRRDVLPEYERSGREDLVRDLKVEIDTLMKYLPQQLTEEELEAIVRQTVEETGASSPRDMGRVMQAVMPKVRGRADGKIVNAI
ncbi:MAG TPA: GatB/YqeY domain-containing protein, partial [Clostridiales bacterium]|nr:GatB/YqeY domain-containing protein [Clostridiales bacterium]